MIIIQFPEGTIIKERIAPLGVVRIEIPDGTEYFIREEWIKE